MNTLKDMVKDNKRVTFKFYKDGNLWYATECGFEFPVPISDIGTATFLAEDKALLFMRYIRPQIKLIEEANKITVKGPVIIPDFKHKGRMYPTNVFKNEGGSFYIPKNVEEVEERAKADVQRLKERFKADK